MRLGIRFLTQRQFAAAAQFPASRQLACAKILAVALILTITSSCNVESVSTRSSELPQAALSPAKADDLLAVDCRLPGQIHHLGQQVVYISRPRMIKTTSGVCAIRGGDYIAYDRANYQTARKYWLEEARQGDSEAQNHLGEIYEKGLGTEPDYGAAAEWYRKAAEQGYAPAQTNLGRLYESGRGVPQDMSKALHWYRQASGITQLDPNPALSPPTGKIAGANTPESPGPAIEMIEPLVPETRGIVLIPSQRDLSERLIVGRIRAPAGLLVLTVNDRDTQLEANGMFRTRVPVQESGSKVKIVAIDKSGRRAVREFMLQPGESEIPRTSFGSYNALVIGNNNYNFLSSLQTARSDAESVGEILRTKYGFKVTTLYDANRYQILAALNDLRKSLKDDDNLLIYYAGHGDLDKVNDRGYWLPVDAEPESTANWISNVQLTDILNIMSVRHILVVADSCYSGTLTRSVLTQLRPGQTDAARTTYYRTIIKKRSRTALTSGGLEPVLDAGSKGHSVFANALMDSLKTNQGMLEGQRLYLDMAARVTQAAYDRRFEQLPQYAPIKFTGHEAGDFFFVPLTTQAGDVHEMNVAAAPAAADQVSAAYIGQAQDPP